MRFALVCILACLWKHARLWQEFGSQSQQHRTIAKQVIVALCSRLFWNTPVHRVWKNEAWISCSSVVQNRKMPQSAHADDRCKGLHAQYANLQRTRRVRYTNAFKKCRQYPTIPSRHCIVCKISCAEERHGFHCRTKKRSMRWKTHADIMLERLKRLCSNSGPEECLSRDGSKAREHCKTV